LITFGMVWLLPMAYLLASRLIDIQRNPPSGRNYA